MDATNEGAGGNRPERFILLLQFGIAFSVTHCSPFLITNMVAKRDQSGKALKGMDKALKELEIGSTQKEVVQ